MWSFVTSGIFLGYIILLPRQEVIMIKQRAPNMLGINMQNGALFLLLLHGGKKYLCLNDKEDTE